jgi:hypothetical protein
MWAIIAAASVVLGSHVRTTDPAIGAVLADALERSAVVRRLVGVIDASNVIVYLARGDCPSGAVGCMMVGGGPDVRYVRINFPLPSGLGRASVWSRDELSISIAHELQHAAEIVEWPEVTDGSSLQAAYLRRGLDNGGSHLDTDAAIEAGEARRLELRHGSRRVPGHAAGGATDGRRGGRQ